MKHKKKLEESESFSVSKFSPATGVIIGVYRGPEFLVLDSYLPELEHL